MLSSLRNADQKRQDAWPGGEHITLEFRGLELGGEAGELLNKLKKLARVRHGIQGQKAEETGTQEADLLDAIRDELADVIICADLIGMELGLDIAGHISTKFDKTSRKNGIPVLFGECLTAIDEIAMERQRQIEAEGWTAEHDDAHESGEMSIAAARYAAPIEVFAEFQKPCGCDDGIECTHPNSVEMLPAWPWSDESWKPSGRRRDLVKAGALIVAEIERLDRAETNNT